MPRPDWVEFRSQIIDWMVRDGAFFYIDRDRVAGYCPICSAVLAVIFKGRTPAVELICRGGCQEADVAIRLGRRLDAY